MMPPVQRHSWVGSLKYPHGHPCRYQLPHSVVVSDPRQAGLMSVFVRSQPGILLAFSPESCSGSPRNAARHQPRTLFAFERIPRSRTSPPPFQNPHSNLRSRVQRRETRDCATTGVLNDVLQVDRVYSGCGVFKTDSLIDVRRLGRHVPVLDDW
jgi:hypothetical protein